MKKLAALCMICALLAGCGAAPSAVEPSGSAEAAPTPSAWGVMSAPSITTTPQTSDRENSSEEHTMSIEESSAAETPEPPQSLTELLPAGPKVIADGVELPSVQVDGTAYVNKNDLESVYSWLNIQTDVTSAVMTGYDGTSISLTVAAPEEAEASAEENKPCIHFTGQTEEYWLPLRQCAEQAGLYVLWDGTVPAVYVTLMPDTSLIPQGRTVPVWMYHEVGNDIWGIESLFVSPDNMREQLQYLKDHGYQTIFFSDLTHLSDYDKPVILTFDDGYLGTYTELFPLLKEFDMKATVFVITASIGTEHDITAEEAKEMSDSGLVSIQSHTVNHPALAELSAEEQEEELKQSQLDIARITGRVPYALSYPTGSYNATTIEIGRKYYKFGVKMNGGNWHIGSDFFAVDRLYAARSTTIEGYGAAMP